jgi:hypothetical protein
MGPRSRRFFLHTVIFREGNTTLPAFSKSPVLDIYFEFIPDKDFIAKGVWGGCSGTKLDPATSIRVGMWVIGNFPHLGTTFKFLPQEPLVAFKIIKYYSTHPSARLNPPGCEWSQAHVVATAFDGTYGWGSAEGQLNFNGKAAFGFITLTFDNIMRAFRYDLSAAKIKTDLPKAWCPGVTFGLVADGKFRVEKLHSSIAPLTNNLIKEHEAGIKAYQREDFNLHYRDEDFFSALEDFTAFLKSDFDVITGNLTATVPCTDVPVTRYLANGFYVPGGKVSSWVLKLAELARKKETEQEKILALLDDGHDDQYHHATIIIIFIIIVIIIIILRPHRHIIADAAGQLLHHLLRRRLPRHVDQARQRLGPQARRRLARARARPRVPGRRGRLPHAEEEALLPPGDDHQARVLHPQQP